MTRLVVNVFYALLHTASISCEYRWYEDFNDFQHIVRSPYYVDKTLLLKAFVETSRIPIITCPSGFGKTTASDMIKNFFDMPIDRKTGRRLDKRNTTMYKLFTDKSLNLSISHCPNFTEQHFGEYVVLDLDFDEMPNSVDEIIDAMLQRIRDLLSAYYWLFDIMKERNQKDEFDIFNHDLTAFIKTMNGHITLDDAVGGLRVLVKFIKKHLQANIMVLIDNYDLPTTRALERGLRPYRVDNFIHNIISLFVTTQDYAQYCMTLGVSRLYKENQAKNRLKPIFERHFLIDHGLAEYFGLTETEVRTLLAANNKGEDERIILKQYHNGYNVRNSFISLYNMSGVIQYLKNGIIQPPPRVNAFVRNTLQCLRHEIFFDGMSGIFRKLYLKYRSPYTMSKRELKTFTEMAKYKCSDYVEGAPYLTPFIDQGYLSYASPVDVYIIPNQVIEEELRQEFRYFYRRFYKVNITNPEIGTAIRGIVNDKNTSYPQLSALVNALDVMIAHLRNRSLNAFQFKSILSGAIFMNLNLTGQAALKKSGGSTKLPLCYDLITVLSDDKETLLIIQITYKKLLYVTLSDLSKFAPHEQKFSSKITLVKYLGLNLNAERQVEIASCANRDNW